MLTFALPKGRLLEEAMPVLAAAGLEPAAAEGADASRRIMVDSRDPDVRLIIVRAADVMTYVGHGAAQLGLVGRDVLLESPLDGVVHGPALDIGHCRLVVAAREGFDLDRAVAAGRKLAVATKYPRLARQHFARAGIQAEIVRLYGSMELAPSVGLSDVIFDLVSTGQTLRANRLVEIETVMEVSAVIACNQAASWRRPGQLAGICARLAAAAGK